MQLVHLRNTHSNDDNIVAKHETLTAKGGKNFQSFSIFNERECGKASVNQYRMFDRFHFICTSNRHRRALMILSVRGVSFTISEKQKSSSLIYIACESGRAG